MDKTNCPHCGANLVGADIPVAHRADYGGRTHFSRQIAIEENDRVVAWKCPDCGKQWPRTEGPMEGYRTGPIEF